MSKTTFPRERMLEVLNEDEGEIVSDDITDTGRWSIYHHLIFKLDGKTWATNYSHGATESQDEFPWDHEADVSCIEVVPVQKTVTVYVPLAETISK